MAETVKCRLRGHTYEFQPGEHVWVRTTFFDDHKAPPETRYSSIIGGDGRATGIIRKKMGDSYMIDFTDGSSSRIPFIEINSIPKKRYQQLGEDNDDDSRIIDDDDDEYIPDSDSDCSNDDTVMIQPNPHQNTLKEREEVYLNYLGKDVLKGTYHDNGEESVHGKTMDENNARFFITKVLQDAKKWKYFNPELHCVGAAVMWPISSVRRMIRKPFSKLGTEATNAKPLGERKRKRNDDNWQKKLKKKAINSGKVYAWKKKNGEIKDFGRAKKVKDRCPDTCKRQCSLVTDESREKIHKDFWSLGSHTLQRGFIMNHVKNFPKERERKKKVKEDEGKENQENSSRGSNDVVRRNRQFTRKYSFTVDSIEYAVCAKFFTNTLDIDEKRVRNTLKSISDTGILGGDSRGQHSGHKNCQLRELPIIDHISKFKTVESHYVRKSAKSQYLPMELNVQEMHRMYVQECSGDEVENYAFYYKVFKERFNLKFHKNKKDKCNACEGFNNTPGDQRTEDQIEEHDLHLDEKESARKYKEMKKKEGEKENIVTAAFDLEKVLLCPHGQASSFYYTKRLKVHNFTVTDIESMFTYCYLWHEGECSKGSAEIGTCLQKFLTYVCSQGGINTINLFSDRCGGQNSNRMVIIALHQMFLQLKLEILEMNFLVTGHSQSENDNAHSVIEQKTRLRTLFTPADWKTAIQMSFPAGKVLVNSLRSEEVTDFKKKESFPEYSGLLNDSIMENDGTFSNKKEGKIYWSKIMQYHFVKSEPDRLFFKYFYSTPEFKYTTIYKKVTTRSKAITDRTSLYSTPIGIDKSKKEALIKLCKNNLIPRDHWKFFEDLKETGRKCEDSSSESSDNEH